MGKRLSLSLSLSLYHLKSWIRILDKTVSVKIPLLKYLQCFCSVWKSNNDTLKTWQHTRNSKITCFHSLLTAVFQIIGCIVERQTVTKIGAKSKESCSAEPLRHSSRNGLSSLLIRISGVPITKVKWSSICLEASF